MALDVYVGSLTRYYSGNWETLGQQYAREQGIPHQTVRPSGAAPDKEVVDTHDIQEAVVLWRSSLSRSLGSNLNTPLDWDERPEAEYFTDRPCWDGYASLILLAAYTEHPDLTHPTQAVEEWNEDAAWLASTAKEFRSRFSQILQPELWLPCDFAFVFKSEDPTGTHAWIGSSNKLLSQLRELNDETHKGAEGDLERWRKEGAAPGGPFEVAARLGLSIFLNHAENSVANHLPMKLDY